MLNEIFLYCGSFLIFLWGIFHILQTKAVLSEFENISKDELRIILMEWLMEGLSLIFVSALAFSMTVFVGPQSLGSTFVYRISSGFLATMALTTLFTGSKTQAIPLKFCPFVEIFCAILFVLGSFL